MFLSILFGFLFLLAPYAEAHRGNPCLEEDYTSSLHGCERGVVDIKPDPYHFDSSRLYDEDEDHRHLPRALGDPGVDYTLTLSEWYGWASSGADLELSHFSGYLHQIPLFDRDFAFESASTCYIVESGGVLSMGAGDIGIPAGTRPRHPFSEEGYAFHENARTYEAGLVQFVRYGGGFDYEKAPFVDDTGKYYEYTVTAWDKRDAQPEVTSCGSSSVIRPSDSSLEISRTFRVYVTDEDESVNNLPVIEESDLSNLRIFENAPADTVICCDWPDVEDREDIDGARNDWTYELLGEDASAFRMLSGSVDPGTGQPNGLMYSTRSFDYETKSEYHLTFRVTDADGGVDEADFTIRIVDLVNEACGPPTINWPHSPAPSNFTESATHIESVPDVTVWDDPSCTEPEPTQEETDSTTPVETRTGSSVGSTGGSRSGGGGSTGGSRSGNSSSTNTTPDSNPDDETQLGPEPPAGILGNPGMDSFQSGIGLISGWVCDAEEVEIELNGEKQAAAYGTERRDTMQTCGDIDNGFGLLFNYNLLGNGEHEVVAYADNVEFGRATFTVTTLGEEFVRDVSPATCIVPDWPGDEESVTLEWQQNSQNFVITAVE